MGPHEGEPVVQAAEPARSAAPAAGAGAPAFRRRGHFTPRRKVCRFCADQIQTVDFKQIPVIRSFTIESGKIISRRVSGVCAKHQRQLARAIKRARHVALVPISGQVY